MAAKLRVVLDTNVVISGLINPKGPPGAILKALREERFILVTSQEINEETLEVMDRPRLRDRYGLAEHLFDIAFILWERAEVIKAPPAVKASKDKDDDKFLAAAVGGLAHYLVSGDIRGLLELGEYQGVKIISPERFTAILESI